MTVINARIVAALSSWIQFWFLTATYKYFNSVIFSKIYITILSYINWDACKVPFHWRFYNSELITSCSFLLLGLSLWGVINKKGFQRKWIWKNIVANVVATDTQGFQLHWISVFYSHFYRFQMRIHSNIHTYKKKSHEYSLCTRLN